MALSQSLTQNGGNVAATDAYFAATIGAAASDRWVVAMFQSNNAAGSVTSAFINGNPASLMIDGSVGVDIGYIYALVPTGTTADFVITGSGGYQLLGAWLASRP